MNIINLSWGELIYLSKQYQGIVFLNLGEENAPHFVLNLVLELEQENVVANIPPCEIFEKTCLMDNAYGHRIDLVLLLKNIETNLFERLKYWLSQQTPHAVMLLTEYMREYNAKFADM